MSTPVLPILFSISEWYLYWYAIYFGFLVVLSSLTIRLGFSQCFVNLVAKTLQLVENCSSCEKPTKRRCKDLADVETNKTEQTILSNEIHSSHKCDVGRAVTTIENGSFTSETFNATHHNSTNSTIKRDLILLPEMRVDLNSCARNECQNMIYDDEGSNDHVDDDEGNGNEICVENEDDSDDYNENCNEDGGEYCSKNVYNLLDTMTYMRAGIEAIVEDQITCAFEAEKLRSWNLLTRNNPHLRFYNWKIVSIWFIGLLFRYLIMIPVRLLNCIFGLSLLFISMTTLSYIPDSYLKKMLYKRITLMCFHLLTRWLGFVPKFHDTIHRPKNGIAVSNHTTPFDVLILNMDNCYSLTGQKHNGFIGFLERTLDRASPHIWFDRTLITDREGVARRLREHVNQPQNPPILIFPEGTCINNTAVVQFKKGAFQVTTTINPIAIKYDNRFGNAFWNSGKQSALQHVLEMMTSWSIVCNIWYLPPMKRNESETAIEFADRVKRKIAEKINVNNLVWDGQVKRKKPKPEWREWHRRLFFEKLKSRLDTR